jgi:hypothetical protein
MLTNDIHQNFRFGKLTYDCERDSQPKASDRDPVPVGRIITPCNA